MLLDRKRVKFWQKWVFAFMALIMAGFLVMIPISGSLGCNSDTTSAFEQIDAEIAKYKAQTVADAADVDAWLGLAENYVLRANQQPPGSDAQQSDWLMAVEAYREANRLLRKEKGAVAKQKRLDTLEQLVTVYLNMQDYQSATGVYQQITGLRPKDAQSFFDLASLAINAGDVQTAMLAFTRFLELDPTSPDAPAVRDWIEANTATASPSPSPSSSAGSEQ